MSNIAIPSRSNTQTIDQTWFNVLQAALSTDFVPRNSSGTATDVGGNLGSVSYSWGALFLSCGGGFNMMIGTQGSGSGNFEWLLPVALPTAKAYLTCDTSGNINYLTQSAFGMTLSFSSGTWSTTSTGLVVIGATNSAPQTTTVLNCTGGLVAVVMQSIASLTSGPAQVGLVNTSTNGSVTVNLYRNNNGAGNVLVAGWFFENAAISTGTPLQSNFTYMDTSAPNGTNVYTFEAQVNASSTTFIANNLVTTAKEL